MKPGVPVQVGLGITKDKVRLRGGVLLVVLPVMMFVQYRVLTKEKARPPKSIGLVATHKQKSATCIFSHLPFDLT